ncbi:MAG: DUF3990 domain-containing protein [Lachnospiraceae bacterium]|nr:DUF3990 domain-containing protein [Lachnospiraceae bacterium]
MKLYHVSDIEIKDPDIRHGRKNADFGQGFYLTPDLEFARKWAISEAVLNEYELNEAGLAIKEFKRDADWFDCIYNNRHLKDGLDADVVMGPIANDTIFDTLGIISSGFLAPEDALKLLLVGPCYIQVAIKSDKARAQLKFIRSCKIEKQESGAKEKEEAEYQEEFAKVMEELDR